MQNVDLTNPSFLAFDHEGRNLYCVHGDLDTVSAFSIDPIAGTLSLLGAQKTGGTNPVHLSIDPSNGFLVVANYGSSSVALLPRNADGSLGALVDLFHIDGTPGPHRVEQSAPQPHQVRFDPTGRWILVPDKGADQIVVLELDVAKGSLRSAGRYPTRQGAGPRHLCFAQENTAYVVNELDTTICAYRFDPSNGSLSPFQILPGNADTFTGDSRAAEIEVSADGRFIHTSVRGSDALSVFRTQFDGTLRFEGSVPSGGRTPRFFGLAGNDILIVANEDSDNVVCFELSQQTGMPSSAKWELAVGSPVCLLLGNPTRPALS